MKWNEAEAEEFRQGRLPVTKFTDPEWKLGDVEEGFKKAALDPRRNVHDRERQPSVPRVAHGDGVLAERQAAYPHAPRRAWRRRSFRSCAGST